MESLHVIFTDFTLLDDLIDNWKSAQLPQGNEQLKRWQECNSILQ